MSTFTPAQRTLVAVLASLALHAGMVTLVAGIAVFRGWQAAKTVDIELTSIKETEVDKLPFGPPPPPRAAAEKTSKGRRAGRKSTTAEAVAINTADAGADGGGAADAGDGGARDTGGDAPRDASGDPDAGVDGGIRRNDQRLAGPAGSRLTALLRLDRLRVGPDAAATIAAVDGLLRHLPDRRRLLDGTGLDLYRDFDVLYIATPNPLDDAVTFLVARHRLSDDVMMAALSKGAQQAGRPITWTIEGGRPVGLRAPRATDPSVPTRPDRDDRILVLPERGLVVMAPPAYANLLLGRRPGADAGASGKAAAAELRWRELVRRIDAEDGSLPEDTVLMMNAANLVSSRRRGPDGTPQPLAGPNGLELPAFVSLYSGVTPAPTLEVVGQWKDEAAAAAWARAWPGWKEQLLGSPLLLFSGFSPLVARIGVEQDGNAIVLKTHGTGDELRRLLTMIGNFIGGGRR